MRLRILELSIQAALIDLADVGNQNQNYHQNATQLLRMVYDLVVLDPNEDEIKKCSPKLLDGVLALLGINFIIRNTISQLVSNTVTLRF